MHDEFMLTFENLWVTFRARWCNEHELDGALAFTHDRVKIDFFHRVVQVNVDDSRMDELVADAIYLFQDKGLECAFTLSPLDHPAAFAKRLEHRGFFCGRLASAMIHCPTWTASPVRTVSKVNRSNESEYEIWADAICRSFGHPSEMKEVGGSVLITPEVRCYLARVDGATAGTTLLYSKFGIGNIDLVGTLPGDRRKGVASALIARAVADSQAIGNGWTSLEAMTGSDAERLYGRLGFRTAYHRHRYIKKCDV